MASGRRAGFPVTETLRTGLGWTRNTSQHADREGLLLLALPATLTGLDLIAEHSLALPA